MSKYLITLTVLSTLAPIFVGAQVCNPQCPPLGRPNDIFCNTDSGGKPNFCADKKLNLWQAKKNGPIQKGMMPCTSRGVVVARPYYPNGEPQSGLLGSVNRFFNPNIPAATTPVPINRIYE